MNDFENIFKGMKVLVVDDEQKVVDDTVQKLEFEEINAYGIINPEEALEHLKTNTVDLIILDWRMPSITGDVFIERLREFDMNTMIILQTGMAKDLPPLETVRKYSIQRIYF